MTVAEREFQSQVDAAAKEFFDSTESNSYLSFHAAVAWVRRNKPPETTHLIETMRRIIQSPQFQDVRLINDAEVAIEQMGNVWS